MNRYEKLVKAHGTYRQFEDAVWNALGEISVKEATEACAKYREDLAEARLADLAEKRKGQPA